MDGRSDIFSIGATLYYCITGCAPYASVNTLEHAQQCDILPHEQDQFVPEGVLAVLKRAMAKNPEDRYHNAADMGRAIGELANGKPLATYFYQQGESISEIGDTMGTAYFILEGLCLRYELDEDGNRINEVALEKGESFDVLSLVSERERTETIEAVTDVTVLEIIKDSMSNDLGLNAWYGKLFSQLSEQYLMLEKAHKELLSKQKS